MDTPLELIISVFDTADGAKDALHDVKQATKDGAFKIKDAAVIVKNAKGHVHMDDNEDVSAGEGALFGAVTGALIGLLGGPAGAVVGAVAGATTGGVTAALVDMGFDDDQLEELKTSLPNNSSALVVLIEHTWVENLARRLEANHGRLFRRSPNPQTNR